MFRPTFRAVRLHPVAVLVVAALSLTASPSADAATWLRLTLEQQCSQSAWILEGRVVSSRAATEPNGSIWTTHEVEVIDLLHGPSGAHPAVVYVKQPGGTVGDLKMEVAGGIQLAPGEHLILFTRDYGAGWQQVANGPQGALIVEDAPAVAQHAAGSVAKVVPAATAAFGEAMGTDLAGVKATIRRTLDGLKP